MKITAIFEGRYFGLSDKDAVAVDTAIGLLAELGTSLPYPRSSKIAGDV